MKLKRLLIAATILLLAVSASAHEFDYSVSEQTRQKLWTLPPQQRAAFHQAMLMQIISDHEQNFLGIGLEVKRRLDSCEMPFESYDKFQSFIADYLAGELLQHVFDHYVQYLFSVFKRLPDQKLYDSTLAGIKEAFLAGMDTPQAKAKYGSTMKELFEQAKNRCSS